MRKRYQTPEQIAKQEAEYARIKAMYPIGYEGYIWDGRYRSSPTGWSFQKASVIRHNKTTMTALLENGKTMTLTFEESPEDSNYDGSMPASLISIDDGIKRIQAREKARAEEAEIRKRAEEYHAKWLAERDALMQSATGKRVKLLSFTEPYWGVAIEFDDGSVIKFKVDGEPEIVEPKIVIAA